MYCIASLGPNASPGYMYNVYHNNSLQKPPGFMILKRTDNELSGICNWIELTWGVFKEIWDGQCILLFNTIFFFFKQQGKDCATETRERIS